MVGLKVGAKVGKTVGDCEAVGLLEEGFKVTVGDKVGARVGDGVGGIPVVNKSVNTEKPT